jgi:hypothetical protein
MAKIISFFISVPPEINRVHYPVRKNRAKVLFAVFPNSRYRLFTCGGDPLFCCTIVLLRKKPTKPNIPLITMVYMVYVAGYKGVACKVVKN